MYIHIYIHIHTHMYIHIMCHCRNTATTPRPSPVSRTPPPAQHLKPKCNQLTRNKSTTLCEDGLLSADDPFRLVVLVGYNFVYYLWCRVPFPFFSAPIVLHPQ